MLLEVIYQRKFVVARAKRTARNMFGNPEAAGNALPHNGKSAKKKKKPDKDAKDSSHESEKNKAKTNESKEPTSGSINK